MLKMQESILQADFVQKLLHIVAEMCSYWSRNCRPIILHENPLDTLGSRWLDTMLEHITLDHTELEADLAFPSKVCKVHLKWKIKFRKKVLQRIWKWIVTYQEVQPCEWPPIAKKAKRSTKVWCHLGLHFVAYTLDMSSFWMTAKWFEKWIIRYDEILQFHLVVYNCKISTPWFNLRRGKIYKSKNSDSVELV